MGFFGDVRESLFGQSQTQQAAQVLSEAHAVQDGAMAHVREGMNRMMELSLAIEDRQWIKVDDLARDERNALSFAAVKSAASHGTALVQGNPVMHRAAEARVAYIHGQGVRISGVDAILKRNRRTVFGEQAMHELEMAKIATGNVLLLVNDDSTIEVIPFHEIEGAVYDPNNPGQIHYFLRKWVYETVDFATGNKQTIPMKKLYRNMDYDLPREYDIEPYIVNPDAELEEEFIVGYRPRTISGVEVYINGVIRHVAPGRIAGQAWGLPDILTGIFYAGEHKELIESADSIIRAQSQYAVQYRAKTRKQLDEVAARVATPQVDPLTGEQMKYGQTVGMGTDVEMQLTQKIGAGMDFRSFDPIAGLASIGLGIPLEVILGQEGHDSTIPFTTKNTMNGVRRMWTEVFEDIFEFLGKRKARIYWPKMDPDPTHRQVQSIVGLAKLKLVSPEEARALFKETFDADWEDAVPDPSLWDDYAEQAKTPAPGAVETPITPGQGQTGQLGKLADGDHELRDEGLQDHTKK